MGDAVGTLLPLCGFGQPPIPPAPLCDGPAPRSSCGAPEPGIGRGLAFVPDVALPGAGAGIVGVPGGVVGVWFAGTPVVGGCVTCGLPCRCGTFDAGLGFGVCGRGV